MSPTIIAIILGVALIGVLLWFVLRSRSGMSEKPRIQHYVFAHKLLPQTFFENPVGVVMPLIISATDRSKPDAAELLKALWQDSNVEAGAQPIEWDPSAFEVTVLSHPNNTVAVIPLPPPLHKAEAHYVAMVFDGPGMAAGNIRQLRYFALEHSGGDVPKTFLSEWSPGDDELKYEIHFEDVEPTVAAFLEKIESLLPASLPLPGDADSAGSANG
jgi:hypothetical protein